MSDAAKGCFIYDGPEAVEHHGIYYNTHPHGGETHNHEMVCKGDDAPQVRPTDVGGYIRNSGPENYCNTGRPLSTEECMDAAGYLGQEWKGEHSLDYH